MTAIKSIQSINHEMLKDEAAVQNEPISAVDPDYTFCVWSSGLPSNDRDQRWYCGVEVTSPTNVQLTWDQTSYRAESPSEYLQVYVIEFFPGSIEQIEFASTDSVTDPENETLNQAVTVLNTMIVGGAWGDHTEQHDTPDARTVEMTTTTNIRWDFSGSVTTEGSQQVAFVVEFRDADITNSQHGTEEITDNTEEPGSLNFTIFDLEKALMVSRGWTTDISGSFGTTSTLHQIASATGVTHQASFDFASATQTCHWSVFEFASDVTIKSGTISLVNTDASEGDSATYNLDDNNTFPFSSCIPYQSAHGADAGCDRSDTFVEFVLDAGATEVTATRWDTVNNSVVYWQVWEGVLGGDYEQTSFRFRNDDGGLGEPA